VIGNMKLVDVRRVHVHAVLDPIVERGAGVMANHTLKATRMLFAWSVDRGLLETNPAAGIRKPTEETPRARVLSDNEVKTLWQALPQVSEQGRAALKLLLLTGQREMEVVGAKWSEIDFDKRIWSLPVAERGRSKARNGVYVVPLSEPVVQVLLALRERNGHGETVFAGIRRINGAPPAPTRKIVSWAKQRLDEKCPTLKDWRIHDLRRTVRTGLSALQVEPHVAELVIGHAIRGIAAVYDRYSYLAEKRDALDRWAAHVMQLVGEPIGPESK
jgi:integrase